MLTSLKFSSCYLFLGLLGIILCLSVCDSRRSHRRRYKNSRHHSSRESNQDIEMLGCYPESIPKSKREIPDICNAINVIQTTPCPFNLTAKWTIPQGENRDLNVSICIRSTSPLSNSNSTSNNDTLKQVYVMTVKELQNGTESNPRHGKFINLGSNLCCFSNGRSFEEMKEEVSNPSVENYFEKAVVWESDKLEHCGIWHTMNKKNDSKTLGKTYKFIGTICNEEKQCWKNEVVSSNS